MPTDYPGSPGPGTGTASQNRAAQPFPSGFAGAPPCLNEQHSGPSAVSVRRCAISADASPADRARFDAAQARGPADNERPVALRSPDQPGLSRHASQAATLPAPAEVRESASTREQARCRRRAERDPRGSGNGDGTCRNLFSRLTPSCQQTGPTRRNLRRVAGAPRQSAGPQRKSATGQSGPPRTGRLTRTTH